MLLNTSQSWMPFARRAHLNQSSNHQIMALWVSDKSRRQGSVCLTKKQESSCAGSTETQTLRALFLNVERKTKHAGEKVVGSLAIKTGRYVARCPKRFIHDIETHASLRLGCYLLLFAFPLFSRNWLSLFGEINRKNLMPCRQAEKHWKCTKVITFSAENAEPGRPHWIPTLDAFTEAISWTLSFNPPWIP